MVKMDEVYYHGAYAVVVWHGRLLTLRKVRGPYKGMLDLPGGGIQAGETPLQALKRELQEEIGCTLSTVHHLGEKAHQTVYQQKLFHHQASLYVVTLKEKRLDNIFSQDKAEASDLVWLPLKETESKEPITFIVQAGIAYVKEG
ncbi:MAG: NUDIX domain-containing protein [Bacteroidota bacterium]